jgi:hypothetical protein
MSKRAENAALKAYPDDLSETITEQRKVMIKAYRHMYQDGYEQSEKDTIQRAITWLKENANKYIVNCTESYPDAPFKAMIGGKCWEDLKQYLETDV